MQSIIVPLINKVNDSEQQICAVVFQPPEEFFSFDAAEIDPRIGTRSFAGIFASHRYSGTPLIYSFGSFSVSDASLAGPGGAFAFDRVSHPVPNPTSMVWGPDDRLYVAEMLGTIHSLTFDA